MGKAAAATPCPFPRVNTLAMSNSNTSAVSVCLLTVAGTGGADDDDDDDVAACSKITKRRYLSPIEPPPPFPYRLRLIVHQWASPLDWVIAGPCSTRWGCNSRTNFCWHQNMKFRLPTGQQGSYNISPPAGGTCKIHLTKGCSRVAAPPCRRLCQWAQKVKQSGLASLVAKNRTPTVIYQIRWLKLKFRGIWGLHFFLP